MVDHPPLISSRFLHHPLKPEGVLGEELAWAAPLLLRRHHFQVAWCKHLCPLPFQVSERWILWGHYGLVLVETLKLSLL
jgi:hypothetical protein